jgi:hypothetical protein
VTDLFPETRVDPGLDLDRRYTTPETMDLCRRMAGVDAFDLDVAADAESHWAPHWYGLEQDGLGQRQLWWGRVWCNPPWSDVEPWVMKAWKSWTQGAPKCIAMLLPANRCEQYWWQELVERHRDGRGDARSLRVRLTTHFLPSRVKFGHPGNPRGVGVGSPPFGCVLLVWRLA